MNIPFIIKINIPFIIDPLIFGSGIATLCFILISSINLLGNNQFMQSNRGLIPFVNFVSFILPLIIVFRIKCVTNLIISLIRFFSFNDTFLISSFSCLFLSTISFMILFIVASVTIIFLYTLLSNITIPNIIRKTIVILLSFFSAGGAIWINNFLHSKCNLIQNKNKKAFLVNALPFQKILSSTGYDDSRS